MGLHPSASLIWGVVVPATDESTGDNMPWWDEDEGFFIPGDDETRCEIVDVGHYEDPDPKGILTLKRLKRYSGDAWDYQEINPDGDLYVNDKQIVKGADETTPLGLPDLRNGRWWLVAGYG